MAPFKHALVSKAYNANDEKVWWYALPAFNEFRRKGSLVTHKTVHNRDRAYTVPLEILDTQSNSPFPGDYRDRASYQEGDFVRFILENVTGDSFGTCDLRLSDYWLHKYLNAPTGVGEDVNVNIFPVKSRREYWLSFGERENGNFLGVNSWTYSSFDQIQL